MGNDALRPLDAVLAELGTDGAGLTTADAAVRRARFGSNALPEPPRPGALTIIADELRNPLLAILAGAAAIAILVGERMDGAVILVALVLTSAFGVGMALRAERALRALRGMLQPTARAIRDGREVELPIADLVPGDRIVLTRGMRIAADARLIAAAFLEVDESALTGESLPVTKSASSPEFEISNSKSDELWQGTTVVEGSAVAVVAATGARTRLAGIAASLAQPRERTPLQEELGRFARAMAMVVLALAVALFGVGLLRGEPPAAMLTLSVAVAVAAIPEGLAVAVTIILAVGAVALARRRCLVRRLVAAETLGSVSVILTDKTGTLTEGRMRVTGVRTPEGLAEFPRDAARPDVQRALRAAVLGTEAVVVNPDAPPDAWEFLGNSTEAALLAAAGAAGVDVVAERASAPRVDRLPFSTDRKYSATLIDRSREPIAPTLGPGQADSRPPEADRRKPHQREVVLIGAPERVVASDAFPADVLRELDVLGGEGFRLVGVARAAIPQTMERITAIGDPTARAELLGVFLLRDALRPDAARALADARAAGIRTVMVTGDHPATAARIARDLGLGDPTARVCTGSELAALPEGAFRTRVLDVDVIARSTPEQKLRIVRAWRASGAVVAVTGDGVNDAPALVGADVGVAMGSGTDVAREASDLVLLDDRYATIVSGIAGGRAIWENLQKTASYLLLSSFSEVILVGGALALGIPIPLVPAQILWVNLLEDTFPAAALAFEPLEAGAMREPPRSRATPLFGRHLRVLVFGVGIASDVLLLAVIAAILARTQDLALARTVAFGGIGINALLFVFGIRSIRLPLWRSRPQDNPWLLAAVGGALALLVGGLTLPALRPILQTVPLPAWGWAIIVGLGVAQLAVIEVVKAVVRLRR